MTRGNQRLINNPPPFPPRYCRPRTGVGVEADGGVKAFAVSEDVQCERHLETVALLLDPQQSALQVEPEADLLQRRPRGRVTVQTGHLPVRGQVRGWVMVQTGHLPVRGQVRSEAGSWSRRVTWRQRQK